MGLISVAPVITLLGPIILLLPILTDSPVSLLLCSAGQPIMVPDWIKFPSPITTGPCGKGQSSLAYFGYCIGLEIPSVRHIQAYS